jgi:hypothetical protein
MPSMSYTLRNPLGRLISAAFSLGLVALLWVTVGHKMLDDIKADTARQGGGGPQSERIVNSENFGPIVDSLRDKVGRDAELLSVTMRPTSVEFVVRDGAKAQGYRSQDGSTKLDEVGVNLYGPGTVADSAFPIAKLDENAPEKIAAAISGKENGDFNLTIATLEREDNGTLLWDMKGRVGERGVAYVAEPNGSDVDVFNPVSPRQSSIPKGVTDIQSCIKAANNDPAKLQACAQGLGG